ncbi:P-loop NTPase fold protein [Bacillus sp. AFS096315]|uniref:KAP family P-loop NTPase fold protein n=1 Tax=Bacillus sp. AFS096315 TaxID=2033517 RepID=UPI000BEE3611|nr:P-loop NTPase fold protein [Bacillus sp. AFS096315]PEC50279.1 NTPase [Bacillus sp. AFS096315]
MTTQNYSSDAPINDPNHDQFNRFPFAQRVASVISKRNDPSSIVIGIYGAWGEGKTSVFNFIESELQTEEKVVCLRFNPWRFGDEDQMLINFFNDLASAIERSIESGKERIGDLIEKYGKPLASLFGKGEAADGVAAFFTGADIVELRERIENLLEEEKKRVVILVDDIDRLEKDEIYAVFRLVKLTADFKYTAYVLAFDKHVVSSALQDRYGADTTGTGNSFLEKIIQVPLQLPSVEYEDLRNFCFNEIDQVLNFSGIELTEEDARQFVGNFSKGLETHLKTPRQAKLYSNILMFSLPILKDETNVVDLMLIEGIRILLPSVYALIRDNKNLFLNDGTSGFHFDNDQKEIIRRKERIEATLEELTHDEIDQVKELLCFLFPKLNKIFRNVNYDSRSELKWSEKQRICSPLYFQRYFTYAITKKDVSDLAINELLIHSEFYSIDDTVKKIKVIMTDKNAETFITKLRRLSKNFTPLQSKRLAVSISKLGDKLPNPVQMFRTMNTFGQAAMFTGDCIENLNNREEQIDLAKEVIHNSDSLSFAIECFKWFRRDTEEYPNPQGFTNDEYSKLIGILVERISKELNNIDKVELGKIEYLPYVLRIWNEYGKPNEASNIITRKIQRDENFVFNLLNSYTPNAFGEFGVRKSNFSSEYYTDIKKLVDPSVIMEAIEKVFINIQIDEQYPEYLEIPRNEELARQFLWLHNNSINNLELND